MFRQFKNIDSAFTHIRWFSLFFLSGCVTICLFTIYSTQKEREWLQSRVYVLAGDKLVDAVAGSRREKLPVEIRDHVRSFHELFFTLEPDEQWNRQQITRAMYLCDSSARIQYRLLTESGYYAGIVSGNISQRLITDSITVEPFEERWHVRFYGRLSIVRATSVVTRTMITEGSVRDLRAISDHNPHGLLIERWQILENKDINITPR
jgi:conjugative transposon TraK protein